MGVQSEVFNKYRALKSTNQIPPFDNPNNQKIDNLEFIDFLFEMVKQTSGQKDYKNIILKGVLSELNSFNEINSEIRSIFKDSFYCKTDFIIPSKYTVESANGITIQLDEVDLYGFLDIDPESQMGRNLYEGNNPDLHVNYLLHLAKDRTETNPMSWTSDGIELFQIYSSSVQNELIFKFGSYYKNRPYALWAEDYLTSINFFNSSGVLTLLMEIISGAVSVSQSSDPIEIRQKNGLIKALTKIFGFCNEVEDEDNFDNPEKIIDTSGKDFLRNLNTRGNNLNEDFNIGNPFDFTADELTELDLETDLKSQGLVRFRTCDDLDLGFDPTNIFSQLDNIFNQRFINGSDYDNENLNINPNLANNLFDKVIKDASRIALDESDEDDIVINLKNIKTELQVNIIKQIPQALMMTIISPKLMLFTKTAQVINGDSDVKTTEFVIDTLKEIIARIGTFITNKILKNIADNLLKEFAKLAKELSIRFLKQRALDYANIFKFYYDLLRRARPDSGCGGIIKTILNVLNGGIITPAPTIPHIAIPFLSIIRPGLNQVAIMNDIKANLQDKGIETAPTFADGTPNYLMYALEETVNTMTQHIKLTSKIDVGGFAGPFPIVGSAMII